MTRNLSNANGNWKCAPDWINVGLGVVLLILAVAVDQVHTGMAIAFGLILIASAVWDLAKPSLYSAAAQGVGGVLIFLLPWFGSFATGGSAWLCWAIAIFAMLCAVWAWASHPTN